MSEGQSFLGTGWGFPPTFGAGGSTVETVSGVDDIRQSLEILLATRLGERVMQDEFGYDLSTVLFEEMDRGLGNALTSLIADAILYHEPRITLDRLDISEEQATAGLLLISLDYTVRHTNTRFNMVYPFYVNEATTSGLA